MRGSVALFGVGCVLATAVAGPKLPGTEWKALVRTVADVKKDPGRYKEKRALVRGLAAEESRRSTLLLLRVAAHSVDRAKRIDRDRIRAERAFEKIDRTERRKLGKDATRRALRAKTKWRNADKELQNQESWTRTERRIQWLIGEALGERPSDETLAAVTNLKNSDARKAREAPGVRRGILTVLLAQSGNSYDDAILALGRDVDNPFARIEVLDWIMKGKRAGAREVAEGCVSAPQPLVARLAVRTLLALDDVRCVGALIAARTNAYGLLAEDLELALYRFTGRKFFGAGAASGWTEWWTSNRDQFLKAAPTARHDAEAIRRRSQTRFYGIPTRSRRIVFAIDRSGSMSAPVDLDGEESEASSGAETTRFDVAKNRLISAIGALPKDARFSVIFFGGSVYRWPAEGGIVLATDDTKNKVIAWTEQFEPAGETPLFSALSNARWFGRVFSTESTVDSHGADTIFLLSDGAPSDKQGKTLSTDLIKEKCAKFLKLNRENQRMTVHTIGIGSSHYAPLLKLLAAETGGTYRAVGSR